MFDYLDKNRNQRKDKTNIIFTNFKTFELRLRRIFEDIDKERTVKRQLYNLRQKESTVIYSISFQHITTNTKWDDTAFTSQFYQELREKAKNKIARIDRLNNLQEMIIRAIFINNRQYESRLKKDKHHSIMLSKKFKEKDYRQFYYESQSMKINVTQRKFQKASERKSQNKLLREQECYTCEKMRHFFKKCTQNRYKNKSSLYDKNDRFITITKTAKTDEHNRLS